MKPASMLLFAAALWAPGQLAAQTDPGATPLVPQKPVERSIAGGETQHFRIALAQGQYLRLIVDPKGAGLRASLLGPDQAKLSETENAQDEPDPLEIALIAPASGTYWLEVRFGEPGRATIDYEVSVTDLRAATAADEKHLAAFRADGDGDRLRAQGKAESRRQAIEKYQAAALLWRAAGEPGGEASTLSKLGSMHFSMGNYVKSLECYLQVVELRKGLGDRRLEARALQSAGNNYASVGQPEKAMVLLTRAMQIQSELGDRRGQAITLNSLALVHYRTGRPQQALECLEEALPLRRLVSDHVGEAYTLHSIGTIYLSMAEQQRALEYFNQALPIWRAASHRNGEANTLGNMAMVHSALGQPQKALEYLGQSLSIRREIGDRTGEAGMLNNFANVFGQMGEPRNSLERLTQALEIYRAAHDRASEALVLNNIGGVYRALGERRKALEYQNQSLAMQRESKDRLGEGITLNQMGSTYRELGDFEKALECYGQALPLVRAGGDRIQEGTVITGMGAVYSSLGQPEKAFEQLSQSQALLHSIGARYHEASALYLLARVERALGRPDAALERITEALNLAESMRSDVAAQELRSSYFATVREQFELRIDLLMGLHRERPVAGFDAEALQTSERARARSLLDLLAEAQADLRQGVEPGLLDRERSLETLLSAKADRQVRLLAGKHTPEQAAAAEKEIRALTEQYRQARAEIRARSPHYAAFTQPRSLTLAEIQREILDPGTVLLEYWLGEERSFLWEITSASLHSYDLPKRAVLEAAAREAYAALSASDGRPEKPLAALSRILLDPVATRLGRMRIVVVSEGALQYLPFAGLLDPRTSRPLLAEHEVVSLPSASTLAVLRRELAGRKPAPRLVAVLADPVFAAGDPRVKGTKPAGGEPVGGKTLQRSAGESGLPTLARLPGSRREAELISSLAPAGGALRALDFHASRATATSADLGRYRILHFATHALLNSQHPELSGLVLSLVDESGRSQNGFLQAHEIYNLKLNADLAVLSACQTALGKDVRGEGLVGITRGFMYAGVPRVVASLWKVPDQATAELMKRFYEALLVRKLRPAAALHQAQLGLSSDPDYSHPYYWAGFTLQGEWR